MAHPQEMITSSRLRQWSDTSRLVPFRQTDSRGQSRLRSCTHSTRSKETTCVRVDTMLDRTQAPNRLGNERTR